MMYSDRDIDKVAVEAEDPGDPSLVSVSGAEAVSTDGEGEVNLSGEDDGIIIIQNPDTGQIFMAQELSAEDLVELGIELVPEGGESGE